MRTYVVAEIGACHEANHDRMLEAIREAAHAGADAVKFQWTSNPVKMAARRGSAAADGYEAIYRRYLAWDEEYHAILSEHCDEQGIDYMCTVYLSEDVETISPYVSAFKVSSFESKDHDFITENVRHASRPYIPLGQQERRVFVSFGLSGDDNARHVDTAYRGKVSPLYCVSSYPTPIDQIHLHSLRLDGVNGRRLYRGFSDHTEPCLTWTGALAVAAGADVVEAHFKLMSTEDGNPDAPHAMVPAQLKDYIRHIRFADTCMMADPDIVDGKPCERPMKRYLVEAD